MLVNQYLLYPYVNDAETIIIYFVSNLINTEIVSGAGISFTGYSENYMIKKVHRDALEGLLGNLDNYSYKCNGTILYQS